MPSKISLGAQQAGQQQARVQTGQFHALVVTVARLHVQGGRRKSPGGRPCPRPPGPGRASEEARGGQHTLRSLGAAGRAGLPRPPRRRSSRNPLKQCWPSGAVLPASGRAPSHWPGWRFPEEAENTPEEVVRSSASSLAPARAEGVSGVGSDSAGPRAGAAATGEPALAAPAGPAAAVFCGIEIHRRLR